MHTAFFHPDGVWQIVLTLLIEYGVFIVAAAAVLALASVLLKNFLRSTRHPG